MRRRKALIRKIILIGDGGVGKTALRQRYMGKGFQAQYLMTVGADFAVKECPTESGKLIKFQIWDLAGQKRFQAVREIYYAGSHGIILVYDVTRPDSFFHVERWLQEFLSAVKSPVPVPVITVANKIDLRDSVEGCITTIDGEALERRIRKKWSISAGSFYETSAKTGDNVNTIFAVLADLLTDI